MHLRLGINRSLLFFKQKSWAKSRPEKCANPEADRRERIGLVDEPLILNADDSLAHQLAHMRSVVLPAARQQASDLVAKLSKIDETVVHLEAEIARIPPAERIAVVQRELDVARSAHEAKLAELSALRIQKQALQRQRAAAETRLDKLGEHDMETRFADDDRQRILKHSLRVRETLGLFRTRVVHATRQA